MRAQNLLLACLVTIFGSAAADSAAPPESVKLDFGWTPGTVAQVETTRQRTRVTGEKENSVSAGARYRMQVQSHEDGLLIAYTDFEPTAFEGADAAQARTADAFMQKVANVSPSFVVSPAAELLRLENVKALRAEMEAAFEPMLDEMKDAPRQLKSLLRTALSEEVLTASAAQEWNAMVGAWAGAEFEPQAVYALEAEEPIPMLGGKTVPMRYEFSLLETVPCAGTDGAPECVVLQMVSSPDPEAMKKLLEGFMQQMTSGTGSKLPAFERFDVTSTVVVVMEPATMLPHRLEIEKRVEGTVSAPGEGSQDVTQVDERISTFTYLQ